MFVDPGFGSDFVSPFARRDAQARAAARPAAPRGGRAGFAERGEGGFPSEAPASAPVPRGGTASAAAATPRPSRVPGGSRVQTASRGAAVRVERVPSGRRGAPSWYDGPDERALREEQARRAQVREEAREIEDEAQDQKKSLKERLGKALAKRKADKVFGSQDGAAAGEGGPRAALYKGEMGSSQRRASRMQSDEGPAEGGRGKASARGRFRLGPKMRIFAASAACLALVCVFLYQPARQAYQSMREHDALAAEYAALQQRGDALQTSVDVLSTDEGMEALAHEQFGLVREGEVSVNVAGVEGDSEVGPSAPPNVSSGGVDAPDTWYSGVLDPLFGVE